MRTRVTRKEAVKAIEYIALNDLGLEAVVESDQDVIERLMAVLREVELGDEIEMAVEVKGQSVFVAGDKKVMNAVRDYVRL